MKRFVVINPNASESMTTTIGKALDPFVDAGFVFRCVSSPDGPAIIKSQRDIDDSVAPMLAIAAHMEQEALGFVIACFSDPGLHALREQTPLPVVGMQEASVSVALGMGGRFGIIAMAEQSIVRQRRNLAAMQVSGRWAGSRALEIEAGDYGDHDQTLAAITKTGVALRDQDGATVVILGCAGMGDYRCALENEIGIPVIEPAQAAASLLIGRALVL